MEDAALTTFLQRAHEYGIELSEHHLHLFRMYLNELLMWNQKMNLIGLSDISRIYYELLLDSLIPIPFIPHEGEMLDIGSGAGFPSIPLKIFYPHLICHLIESKAKKVSFLKHIIRLLHIDSMRVIKTRIEDDSTELISEGYGLITARAVADMGKIIRWSSPYLAPRGRLVNFIGSHLEETIMNIQPLLKRHSLIIETVIPYTLPGNSHPRHVLISKKSEILPLGLSR